MTLSRIILRDVLSALVVLALVFLNFGHTGAGFATERGIVSIGAESWCGDPPDRTPGADPNPCQACRITAGLDLPPAPCAAEPVFLVSSQIDHSPWLLIPGHASRNGSASATGPPTI